MSSTDVVVDSLCVGHTSTVSDGVCCEHFCKYGFLKELLVKAETRFKLFVLQDCQTL